MKTKLLLPFLLLLMLGQFQSLKAATTITSFTPATGAVGTLVTITGTNLSSPSAFTIGGKAALIISSTATQLVGLVMPGATTGTVSVTNASGTATGTGNFTVTATPYPGVQQGDKFAMTAIQSLAGEAVAVSADGNTAVVGGTGYNSKGGAWIYTRSGASWSLTGTLSPPASGDPKSFKGFKPTTNAAEQTPNPSYGFSVAISADGNTAIVGGPEDGGSSYKQYAGAAWVWTRSGATWSCQTKLEGSGTSPAPIIPPNEFGSYARQGFAVSLSADGNTALVGGPKDNINDGAVWVFTRSGGAWSQLGNKLLGVAAVNAGRQFGRSLSISADGKTFIAGGGVGVLDDGGGALVFSLSGNVWSWQGSLVASPLAAGASQGVSVSLSADGNTALVGGDGADSGKGAVWVWSRSGSTWSVQQKMTGSDAIAGTHLGTSVSLSADGNTAMAGGPFDNSQAGASWVFTREGSIWSQKGTKMVGAGTIGNFDNQGQSVALSADGTTGLQGGRWDDSGKGAVWSFGPVIPLPSTQASSIVISGTTNAQATIGWTNGNGAKRAVFVYAGNSGNSSPVNGTTYTANTAFGSGTQIGSSGWYCVYNGTGTSVTVTGLSSITTYRVMVLDYNGSAGSEMYFTDAATDNPKNFTTLNNIPVATTQAVTTLATTTATGNGTLAIAGGINATARGLIIYPYTDTDKAIGEASVTTISEAGSFGNGSFTASFTGLSANTRYNARAYGTNALGTGYGSRVDCWTLADVPSAPTVINASATTMDVAVNANGNPAATEFCINETGTTKFVQSDGTLGVTAVWQTAAAWGTKTVTGLSVNTTYTYQVKARNGSNVETAYSGTATLVTLSNVPSAPTVNSATTTTLDVTVNVNSNPSTTVFAIQESVLETFVQSNGTLGGTAVWQTAAAWATKTVTGLSVNTSYTFQVKAKNSANVETAYSSTAALNTLANVPSAPTVNNATATTLDVAVNVNGNPSSTEFCINETSTTNYVQANGTLGAGAVWQTAAVWATKTVTGLTTGSTYTFKVQARNGNNVVTAYSLPTSGIPVAKPTVTTQSGTSIAGTTTTGNGNITAINGINPTTRGIIWYTYTNSDKLIGDAGVTNVSEAGSFGTGAFTSTLTGLAVNTQYNAIAYATNTIGTGYGARVAFWTLANVPSAPTVNNATATTLDVAVNVNGNPATTEFCINETSTTNYVQANGTLGAGAVWQTAAVWATKTVTGLTAGSTYTFKVKARNGELVETAYSATTSGTTCKNPTGGGTISADQTICSGATPTSFASVTLPSGYGGTLEYKWQQSITSASASFSDIASSNAATYAPGALSANTWFKRVARVTCETDWTGAAESNVIAITMNISAPTVTVQGNTSTTATTSTANGTITQLCTNATNRGAIWYAYTGTDKIIVDAGVTNVSETGSFSATTFTAALTGLTANKRYNLRAHSTNTFGTGYSAISNFWTLANAPDAPTVDNAAATSLRLAVNVNGNPDATEFCINETSTTNYVQANGTLGAGAVWQTAAIWGAKIVTGLTTGSTYTFKVKARNGDNVETAYGATASGMPVDRPIVTTQATSSIAVTTATANGTITAINGINPTTRGTIWYNYTNSDKLIGDAGVTNVSEAGSFGTGAFTSSLTGLTVNTQYNAIAYATNTIGTGYGARVAFWTLANVPSAPTVNNATATTLDVAVNVNGNPATTEFCINETSTGKYVQANGTLDATAVWQTATTWSSKTVTSLITGSTYTFQVKARNGNNVETAYGATASGIPVNKPTIAFESPAVTSIAETAVTSNENITSTNGANATNRGVIWYEYTGTDKIIGDAGVTNVSSGGSFGTGIFSVSLTGLLPNTRYNARAHATNPYGTSYSTRTDFRTLANVPAAPTVNNASATTLDVAVNVNGNPVTTEFCINETSTTNFVQANGTLGATAVWQTAAIWGTKTVAGLTMGSTYTFKVKARNADLVETLYSATASGITCTNPTGGGTISASQNICFGSTPSGLVSLSLPSGYGGTLQYKWQVSTTSSSAGFSDIASSNSASYAPGALSTTTWYKRLSRVDCKADWTGAAVSNVIQVSIDPVTVGGSIAGSGSVCSGSNSTTLSLSGQTGSVVKWQKSTDGWTTTTDVANTTTTLETTNLSVATNYHAIVQSGICSLAISAEARITINPDGQVNQPVNQILFDGSTTAVTFTTANSGGITTYAWTNSTTAIGLAGSGTGDMASFKVVNKGTAPVVATIVVTPIFTNEAGCTGTAKTFTITVKPLIAGDTNGDGKITYPEMAGDKDGDHKITYPEIAGDINGDGKITAPEITGDTNGDGKITAPEIVGDTNGNGTIDGTEVTGDTNGDGKIDGTEVLGDTNGDGTKDVDIKPGDTNGDGKITAPEIAGDINGDGKITPPEIAGDTNGDRKITYPEIVGDTNGDGKITAPEIAGDINSDGKLTYPEVAGDTNGDGKITAPEVAGDTNGDGKITAPEVAGDTNGDGKITAPEIAGDTNGDGKITAPEVAGDTNGDEKISGTEIAGDTNGDGKITYPEIAGDINSDGKLTYPEVAGDTNGDGKITAPEVAGDTNGDEKISGTEIAGDTNGDGKITYPEITGDTNGDGKITAPEIAGDTNGDGKITYPEIVGDTNGDGKISGTEIAGDTNGDGKITYPEITGDTNGDGKITAPEIAGDTNGDGKITYPEIVGDTNGDGKISGTEIAGDTNCDGRITYPEIAGDTNGNGRIDGGEIAGDTSGDGKITVPEISGDTNGDGKITESEIAGDSNGNMIIDSTEIMGDTNGDGKISGTEIAGDSNGDGKIAGGEISGDPTVQLRYNINQLLCSGSSTQPVGFSVENTGGTTTYAWTNNQPGIGLAASSTGNIASFTAINPGAAAVVATIQVIPTFTVGTVSRIGQAKSFTIMVNPLPAATAGADRTICPGTSTTLGVPAVAGSVYIWGSVPAGYSSMLSSPVVSPSATTRYTLTEINTVTGCSNSQSVLVTVKPTYQLSVSGTSNLCAGTKNVVYSTTPGMSSYQWTLPSGAAIVSGANTSIISVDFSNTATPGNVRVSGTTDCGTVLSENFAVSVKPLPATPSFIVQEYTLISSADAGNQWYLGGQAVTIGGNGRIFSAPGGGSVALLQIINGCASALSPATVVIPMAANVLALGAYPNPNQGQFQLTMEYAGQAYFTIEVYNEHSQLLYRKEKVYVDKFYIAPIDLYGVSSGTYYVRAYNADASMTIKVMVNR